MNVAASMEMIDRFRERISDPVQAIAMVQVIADSLATADSVNYALSHSMVGPKRERAMVLSPVAGYFLFQGSNILCTITRTNSRWG